MGSQRKTRHQYPSAQEQALNRITETAIQNLVVKSITDVFETTDDFWLHSCDYPDCKKVKSIARWKRPNNHIKWLYVCDKHHRELLYLK